MKLYYFVILLIYSGTLGSTQDICDTLTDLSGSEISEKCLNQLEIVCRDGSLLWRMFDASSKYPHSGMSYSNNQDLGNFDECVNINYESGEDIIKGKYCGLSVAVVNFFLNGSIPNPFKLPIEQKSLAQFQTFDGDLKSLQRDLMDDFSISVLSTCVPDQCTPQEVGKFFIWGSISLQGFSLVYFVDKLPCLTKDSNTEWGTGDIIFTTFLAFIGLLIASCTCYDFYLQKTNRKSAHPIFLAFSLITNGKKILHTTTTKNPTQIHCLNGIRFISMMWVICGHNFVAMENIPLINWAEVRASIDNPAIQYASASPIAVDTFFFLSGFLLAYSFLKSAMKLSVTKQVLGVPMMIIHRYLRLTPAVAILFFVSITIYKFLGTGPYWNYVADSLNRQCRDHWWDFFLYIQNYVSYNDMCLNHTWYLSADMQMFLLAPIVLIPLAYLIKNNNRNLAYYCLFGLIFVCVVFPMAIRYADHTIDNVYDSHSRFNDYLIGVLLGVVMRDSKFQRFPFNKLQNLAIWCFVLICDISFILYYHNIIRIYDHTADTTYYGLYRPVWSFSLAWMIYSCYHGYGGPVNWLLSLPMFQVGARLSYCMYLLHAVVQMYWVGLIRTPYYWENYHVFYVWCGHFVVTMILSFVWSLAFESPMIVIEKCIFGGGGRQPQKPQETKQVEA